MVSVDLGARSYEVHIGHDLVDRSLSGIDLSGGIALITDGRVAQQPWFSKLQSIFKKYSSKVVCYQIAEGEKSKSLAEFSTLCSRLAQDQFSRKATVIAVGGGVVGDLSGYVAASYLRGVSFIQLPTTLLAAVDSSVGGKTGVNLPEGKNLVGAFYQPQRVIIDLNYLDTLEPRQISAGMAEVIKYGLIWDKIFFEKIAAMERGDKQDLAALVKRCVEIKAAVVTGDEREESGLRAILNYGHTLGHAIEQSVGYGELLHGEAISIGMVAATYLSEQCSGLGRGSLAKVQAVLEAHGLPVRYTGLCFEQLKPALLRDKKTTQLGIQWVLLPELGRAELRADVTQEQIEYAIKVCTL